MLSLHLRVIAKLFSTSPMPMLSLSVSTKPGQVAQRSVLPFARTEASVLLDFVRGLAALLVLLDHWRNLLFVDFPQLPVHRALWAVPYVLTSAGHQAVVIFFVLSGYLIGGSVFRSYQHGVWRWGSYLTHRVVRLWTVLLSGLLLCVLWDSLGLRLGRAPLLYAGAAYNHLTPPVLAQLSPSVFFGNLFFLQGIHVPTLGSNGALWSLSFEFWYYLLFPLGVRALLSHTPRRARFACLALFIAAAIVAGPRVLEAFPLWLLGTLLARMRAPELPQWARTAAAAVYVPLLFGLAKFHTVPGLLSDYILGFATFGLLYVLLSAQREADPVAPPVRVSRGLARFSFTLYVAHLPFATLLTSLVARDTRFVPQGRALVLGFTVLLATLLYAWALAALTEFHTEAVRLWTELQLGHLRALLTSLLRFSPFRSLPHLWSVSSRLPLPGTMGERTAFRQD